MSRYIVSFKSVYQGEADYMVYDRTTNEEHRVRVNDSSGKFLPCCDRVPPADEQAAVRSYRERVA